MDRTKKSMRTETGGKYYTVDGVGGAMGICTLLKGGHSIVSSREVCWRQPISCLGLTGGFGNYHRNGGIFSHCLNAILFQLLA
jgi:hypothetical protein